MCKKWYKTWSLNDAVKTNYKFEFKLLPINSRKAMFTVKCFYFLLLVWRKSYWSDLNFKLFVIMASKGLLKNVSLCTAQKMKFSIKNFSSKCDQIRRKLRIWSHLLKKSLMENIIFCAVKFVRWGWWELLLVKPFHTTGLFL